MPQSLSNVLLHVIFSTKDRVPVLQDASLRKELHAYLIGTLRDIDCPSLKVGGVADHVHALCRLARTITIADLIEAMKTSSSKWVKREAPHVGSFYWQNGYAAFSVSPSNEEQVNRYIENQETHHRTQTYQDELRAFLHNHAVDFDERYVWD
jgi:REP element-mobilizing transposase RayT